MSPSSISLKLIVLFTIGFGLAFGVVGGLSPTLPAQAASAGSPTMRPQAAGIVTTCNEASLRAALIGGGTVTFDCSGVITVASSLSIAVPTTIDGSGQSVTLSGGNTVRIIDTTTGVGTLAMQNITLTNGFTPNTSQSGGALRVLGNLVLTNTTVISNYAGANGGGIYVTGTLMLTGVQFISNVAYLSGGGVYANGTVTLKSGLFQNNQASSALGGGGGGMYAAGAVTSIDGLFQNNACIHAGCYGGGLYGNSTIAFSGTRYISNTADSRGGGLYAIGAVSSIDGLFQDNACTTANCYGGGLYANSTLALSGTWYISNTGGSRGGGAYVNGATALTSGLFQNNRTTNSNGEGGGGLYVQSTLTLTDTQFMSNTTPGTNGGGGALAVGDATLNGGLFQSNRANNPSYSGYGGGLNAQSTLTLTNTQFINNSAPNGGGASAISIARLNGGLFQGNRIDSYYGGGLYANSTLTLTGTQFISNTGFLGGSGAGVYMVGGGVVIGALFQYNRAGGNGGGLWTGYNLSLTNTQFIYNMAGSGGGLYQSSGAGRVVNTLFSRNEAGGNGTALNLASSGNVQILHTTIADTDLNTHSAIYVSAGTVGITDTIVVSHVVGLYRSGGTVYADYNLFYYNTTSKIGTIGGGTHDVSGDPVFVEPANDDYHLGADSAAVDTGIDAGVITDFDGNTRPKGIGFDIGYDEVLQQCGLSPSVDYAFSNPSVTLNFSAMGNVNCAAAVYFPRAAPHATGTVGHGVGADHFWQIAAREAAGQPATGFTVSITAPHSDFTNPRLCFYPGALGGAGWDCTGIQTYNLSTVTRQAITHFSDWAVGDNVGPTAVMLQSVSANIVSQPISFLAAFFGVSGMLGLFLIRRRPQRIE